MTLRELLVQQGMQEPEAILELEIGVGTRWVSNARAWIGATFRSGDVAEIEMHMEVWPVEEPEPPQRERSRR